MPVIVSREKRIHGGACQMEACRGLQNIFYINPRYSYDFPEAIESLYQQEFGTSLCWAVKNGYKNMIDLITHPNFHGVKATLAPQYYFVESYDKNTVLHIAASVGNTDLIGFLLEKIMMPVDYRTKDLARTVFPSPGDKYSHLIPMRWLKDGKRTPLHCAAEAGEAETIKYLLERRADVNLKTDLDRTALYLAVQKAPSKKVEETVKVFLDYGADILKCQTMQNTILHLAAFLGYEEVVELLLKAPGIMGIIEASDIWGNTPLDLARMMNHQGVAQQLVLATTGNVGDFDFYDPDVIDGGGLYNDYGPKNYLHKKMVRRVYQHHHIFFH